MSYQDSIGAVEACCSPRAEVGIFRTREDSASHLRQTESDMTTFYADVLRWSSGNPNPDDQRAAAGFTDFYHRWKEYLRTAASSILNFKQVDESENWRRRLAGWRATFIGRGMRPTTPEPQLPPQRDPLIVPIVIAAGSAVLGAYLIDRVIRKPGGF